MNYVVAIRRGLGVRVHMQEFDPSSVIICSRSINNHSPGFGLLFVHKLLEAPWMDTTTRQPQSANSEGVRRTVQSDLNGQTFAHCSFCLSLVAS